jgi:hypothetical protein
MRGGDSTLPALPLRWRLPIGSRQGRETKKIQTHGFGFFINTASDFFLFDIG